MASPTDKAAIQPVPVPQDEVGSVQAGEFLVHVETQSGHYIN